MSYRCVVNTKPCDNKHDFADWLRNLEDEFTVYEEASGKQLDPDYKISAILKGAPEEVRTQLQLSLDENTTYEHLRSRLMNYDSVVQQWPGQPSSHGSVAMEVDRIQEDSGKGG